MKEPRVYWTGLRRCCWELFHFPGCRALPSTVLDLYQAVQGGMLLTPVGGCLVLVVVLLPGVVPICHQAALLLQASQEAGAISQRCSLKCWVLVLTMNLNFTICWLIWFLYLSLLMRLITIKSLIYSFSAKVIVLFFILLILPIHKFNFVSSVDRIYVVES